MGFCQSGTGTDGVTADDDDGTTEKGSKEEVTDEAEVEDWSDDMVLKDDDGNDQSGTGTDGDTADDDDGTTEKGSKEDVTDEVGAVED